MLELKGVCKTTDLKKPLTDINLTAEDGLITVLLGAEGSGKTLICDIAAGVTSADAGTVLLDGQATGEGSAQYKKNISYMPEDPSVFRDMTSASLLRFVGQTMELSTRLLNEKVESVLKQTGLKEAANVQARRLPEHYLQRLSLAQAIMGEASTIVLDCPGRTGDAKQVQEFRSLLRDAVRGKAVLYATDNVTEARLFGDKVYVLDEGTIVGSTDMAALADLEARGEWTLVSAMGDEKPLEEAARAAGYETRNASRADDTASISIKTGNGRENRAKAVKALVEAGVRLLEVRSEPDSLKEIIEKMKSSLALREEEEMKAE
ncbi:MAG: ABC transporter ATP-binding protein [Clostridia bacterium]|nr:ABC transporter ATP-binding protein [Clostridia bacterium]